MKPRPLIGITMTTDRRTTQREFVNKAYLEAIDRAGGIPVPIPNTANGLEVARVCSGLLFSGGGDIDPSYYGDEADGVDKSSIEPQRDLTEKAIIGLPEFSQKPVFGICRGIQSLAAFQGSKLIQDVPAYQERARARRRTNHSQQGSRSSLSHAVRVQEGSLLSDTMHVGYRMVNSMHHQVIAAAPPGWKVSALSDDGFIEAIESRTRIFRMAVQWHPEELYRHSDVDRMLFEAFVRSCAALAAGPPQPLAQVNSGSG